MLQRTKLNIIVTKGHESIAPILEYSDAMPNEDANDKTDQINHELAFNDKKGDNIAVIDIPVQRGRKSLPACPCLCSKGIRFRRYWYCLPNRK